MPRVTFKTDFDCPLPGGRSYIEYKAGYSGLIPTAHYQAALTAGAIDGDAGPGPDAEALGGDQGQAKGGDQGSVKAKR